MVLKDLEASELVLVLVEGGDYACLLPCRIRNWTSFLPVLISIVNVLHSVLFGCPMIDLGA